MNRILSISRGRAVRSGAAALLLALLAACGGPVDDPALNGAPEGDALSTGELGPVDEVDGPAWAPERVAVGDPAPDFRLESYRGDTLALTDYRGKREVILVFYRGSW